MHTADRLCTAGRADVCQACDCFRRAVVLDLSSNSCVTHCNHMYDSRCARAVTYSSDWTYALSSRGEHGDQVVLPAPFTGAMRQHVFEHWFCTPSCTMPRLFRHTHVFVNNYSITYLWPISCASTNDRPKCMPSTSEHEYFESHMRATGATPATLDVVA
jgi:hypothetical protein